MEATMNGVKQLLKLIALAFLLGMIVVLGTRAASALIDNWLPQEEKSIKVLHFRCVESQSGIAKCDAFEKESN